MMLVFLFYTAGFLLVLGVCGILADYVLPAVFKLHDRRKNKRW